MKPDSENSSENVSAEPGIQERQPDKVIAPLDPNLKLNETKSALLDSQESMYPTPTIIVDVPKIDGQSGSTHVPLLSPSDLGKEERTGWISIRHKSLLVLSIAGLLTVVYSIISVIRTVHIVNQIQISDPSLARSYQISLDFVYVAILTNTLIYGYFLVTENVHTLSLVLKIFIVIEFIAVFGVFFGSSLDKIADLLINFIFLIYAYIVLTIVRSG